MKKNKDDKTLMHRIRRLTQALIVSGACNIALVAFLFYWSVKERPPTPYCERKPIKEEQQGVVALESGNSDLLRQYGELSMEQLTALLTSDKLVENGYKQRDLALASLVSYYHFDLSRALAGYPILLEKRKIGFGISRDGTRVEVIAFPGLNDHHFQTIIHFAKTEKWPLTAKGLWLMLRQQAAYDPTVADAFFLTPEFLAVETLFSRGDVNVAKADLLKVVSEGSWEKLSEFTQQQRLLQDLSAARRQRFLLDSIRSRSRAAAQLMLTVDADFAVKKLDDEQILMMLELLDQKNPETERFARSLLVSPRSDAVWKMAATRLYTYVKEPIPETYLHEKALARFVPGQAPFVALTTSQTPKEPKKTSTALSSSKPVPPPSSKPLASTPKPKEIAVAAKVPPKPQIKPDLSYVVQDGDTLWKISKRFKVDVDAVRKLNRLDNDTLKPGTTLKIPQTK